MKQRTGHRRSFAFRSFVAFFFISASPFRSFGSVPWPVPSLRSFVPFLRFRSFVAFLCYLLYLSLWLRRFVPSLAPFGSFVPLLRFRFVPFLRFVSSFRSFVEFLTPPRFRRFDRLIPTIDSCRTFFIVYCIFLCILTMGQCLWEE